MSLNTVDPSTLAELRDAAGEDFARTLFGQIRADFARLHDAALAQMRSFGPSGAPDFDLTRRVVHELKGLSLTVGAHRLAEVCAEAEGMAQQRDTQALAKALPDIIAQCDRVRIELEQSIAGAE